jgi:hypothetical protein
MHQGKKIVSLRAAATLALTVAATLSATSQAADGHGAVYALTNQASGNSVMVFDRAANGTLTYSGTFSTGGTGAGTGGDPLGSQGALTLHDDLLLAVNAGSNDVSLLRIVGDQLVLLDKVSSGGQEPVSIAVKGQLVYVLNAGGTPNISGFYIDWDGRHLNALADSTQALPGGTAAAPAEVHFARDGETLLVTEKGTQSIDAFRIDRHGYAVAPTSVAANGVTPFGFGVTWRGYAVISEAGSGSAASYEVGEDGKLAPIGAPIALGEKAPCWLVTTHDGRYAYTANAGSGDISALRIHDDGALTLINASAGTLAAPLDMAFSLGDGFLYARDGTGSITGFQIGPDGTLTLVTVATGIPAGAQGIAAR